MSIEITVEPVSAFNKNNRHPSLPACPPGCVPAAPRCPPGCVPACPPGYRRAERHYKCRPVNRQSPQQSLSPRISQIIDNQLRKIAESQQRQQLQRTQSDMALSPNPFALASPAPASANASGYALSHAASVSASVDQLPAAIKEVLSVADNVVPMAGKVTYINSASCPPSSPPPRPATPPPPPPPPPRRVYRPRPRPSSPYEVLPLIHVDRCDPCDPCNRNRRLDADCYRTSTAQSNGCGEMTIEIEISHPTC